MRQRCVKGPEQRSPFTRISIHHLNVGGTQANTHLQLKSSKLENIMWKQRALRVFPHAEPSGQMRTKFGEVLTIFSRLKEEQKHDCSFFNLKHLEHELWVKLGE